jgi:hypothetical protein
MRAMNYWPRVKLFLLAALHARQIVGSLLLLKWYVSGYAYANSTFAANSSCTISQHNRIAPTCLRKVSSADGRYAASIGSYYLYLIMKGCLFCETWNSVNGFVVQQLCFWLS